MELAVLFVNLASSVPRRLNSQQMPTEKYKMFMVKFLCTYLSGFRRNVTLAVEFKNAGDDEF